LLRFGKKYELPYQLIRCDALSSSPIVAFAPDVMRLDELSAVHAARATVRALAW
jgi:hypothetical protein